MKRSRSDREASKSHAQHLFEQAWCLPQSPSSSPPAAAAARPGVAARHRNSTAPPLLQHRHHKLLHLHRSPSACCQGRRRPEAHLLFLTVSAPPLHRRFDDDLSGRMLLQLLLSVNEPAKSTITSNPKLLLFSNPKCCCYCNLKLFFSTHVLLSSSSPEPDASLVLVQVDLSPSLYFLKFY